MMKAVREQSSSGGIFQLLAADVIQRGGIVFGAAFDEEWEVHHTSAEKINDLENYGCQNIFRAESKITIKK